MKLSIYLDNIIDAIFFPNFLIEEREDNKKLKELYENCITANKDFAEAEWKEAYKYAKQVDYLNEELSILKRDYKNLVNLNSDLNRKLERYYKTRKNFKKK